MNYLQSQLPGRSEQEKREFYERTQKDAFEIMAAVVRADEGSETWEQQREAIKQHAIELTAAIVRYADTFADAYTIQEADTVLN